MKMPESFNKRRLSALALLCAGGLAVSACGSNPEGEGNAFKVIGTVHDVGKHSVAVHIDDILYARGKAIGWFNEDAPANKTHRVHDNILDCEFLGDLEMKKVGRITDISGRHQELADIQFGEQVELSGKIRDSFSACGEYAMYDLRPVFDRMVELPAASRPGHIPPG